MLSLLLSPPQRESMCSHWQSFADRDGSCSKEQGQREEMTQYQWPSEHCALAFT